MPRLRPLVPLLLLLACGPAATTTAESDADRSRAREVALQELALFEQELEVVDLLLELRGHLRAEDAVLRDVRIVDSRSGSVGQPVCVATSGGRITAVDGECPSTGRQIDGRGLFLAPGLVDMHVHQLETSAIHILNVANGVTTVRDMGGFPWLLEWREQARSDALFAPSMIVAGKILSSHPMGWYSEVVESPEAARAAVGRQAELGYDAIKVHNVLPRPVYLAIAEEARARELPLVGHVPHRLAVREAVAAGQRTIEHLKGYIDDRTLRISEDDFVEATRDYGVWNTPTLYANRLYLRGSAVERWAASAEARYVSSLRRREWLETADDPLSDAHRQLLGKQQQVLRRLLPVTERFLAGTDAGGGYPFMVPGFGLHEELRMLEEAGLTPLQAFRAATLNPALATGREGELGEVVPGARADLLLLSGDPLASLDDLSRIEGVMLRGSWLSRADLDAMLERLAAVKQRMPQLAQDPATPIDAWARRIEARLEAQRRAGFVHPEHQIRDLERHLETLGRGRDRSAETDRPRNVR